MGKPVLMSSIAVHLQQAPDHGHYFDCDDPAALKDLMLDLWIAHEAAPHAERAETARKDLDRRTKDFGRTYLRLIKSVTETV